jgi:hypothetical protein
MVRKCAASEACCVRCFFSQKCNTQPIGWAQAWGRRLVADPMRQKFGRSVPIWIIGCFAFSPANRPFCDPRLYLPNLLLRRGSLSRPPLNVQSTSELLGSLLRYSKRQVDPFVAGALGCGNDLVSSSSVEILSECACLPFYRPMVLKDAKRKKLIETFACALIQVVLSSRCDDIWYRSRLANCASSWSTDSVAGKLALTWYITERATQVKSSSFRQHSVASGRLSINCECNK